MSPVGVVVFDLDDTLYLERDFVHSGYAAVGSAMKVRLGTTDFAARAEAAFERGERTRVFDVVLAELGYAGEPALIDEAIAVYRNHTPTIRLADDAKRYLENCPHQLALLSDGYAETQAQKVAALGLAAFGISPIVLTGSWGREYWKPHVRGFLHIQAWYGLAPASFVYVADNPAKDFVAPRALGWRSVQIARPGRIHIGGRIAAAADAVITSLDDLGGSLVRLAA